MKINKSIILIIIALIIIVGLFFLGNINNKKDGLLKGKYYVEMSVIDYGKVTLELDADNSPITVTNFMKLVNDKFYDGLTFHRIIKGFMIQGGGYIESGERKVTNTIKGEFNNNGITNNLKHKRGVISMARTSNDYNSASSQFFIMHEDNSTLDGNYASFGKVINGMDVIDEIANVNVIDDNGSVSLEDRPVIEYIREIEVANTYEK